MNITNRKIWNFSWPVILSNISIPILDICNTGILGHLPDPIYLAGFALGIMLVDYIYVSLNFLRMGTTGLTAQAFGNKNNSEIVNSLFRSLMISISIGIFLVCVQSFISKIAFNLFLGSPEVERLGKEYYFIRIFSAFACLSNFAIAGWLLGIQRPKLALFIQIFMNGLNVLLALVFVLKLDYKLQGLAYATVISEILTFIIGMILVCFVIKRDFVSGISASFYNLFNKEKIKQIFKLNGNIFIRSILLISAFAWFTNFGAQQGDVILAANEILILFLLFMSFALDGFAQASEILVGDSIGAKNLKNLKTSIRLCGLWALSFAIGFSFVYYFCGGYIIDLLTSIPDVRVAAKEYLIWLSVLPLVGIWCYLLDGVFIGATESSAMRDTMIISFIIYSICVNIFIPIFGNNGLWFSLLIFLGGRAGGLYLFLPRIYKKST